MWKYQITLKKFYKLCGNEPLEEKIIARKMYLKANNWHTNYASYSKLDVLNGKNFLRRFQKKKIIYWEITSSGRIALNELFNIDCLTNEDIIDMSKAYLKGKNPIAELRMQGTK